MSPVLEFESKSVEKALQKASQRLNIPPEKLVHDIISYGSSGIFGLVGSKKAKIRVTVPEDEEVAVITTTDDIEAEIEVENKEIVALVDDAFGKRPIATEVSQENAELGKDVLQKVVDSPRA